MTFSLFQLLVALGWSIGDTQVQPATHYPPSSVKTFLRDSVEHRPLELFRKAQIVSPPGQDFGTRSLPLRSAVESLPEVPESRIPLRDAVERRISPLEDLQDQVSYDVNQEMLSHYHDLYRKAPPPRTSAYSPFTRYFIPPYRIDNPYQRIVGIGEVPGEVYPLRRARQAGSQARFAFANKNLAGE